MCEANNVNTTCLRYIVPFKFDGSFNDAVSKIDHNELWERCIDANGLIDSDLYSYVRNEFKFDDSKEVSSKKMGFEWSFKHTGTIKELIYSQKEIKKFDVAIADAGLLVFRNNLGLFWYELAIKDKSIDSVQLLYFQNKVREINSGNIAVLWEKKNEDSNYLEPFSLAKWLHKCISYLGVNYFSERPNAYKSMLSNSIPSYKVIEEKDESLFLPNKAILFTYASLEDNEKNNKFSYVFHLTNGYDDSYHFSEEISEEIKQPFDNAYWYATQEGASYIVWPSEDNKHFYNDYFVNNRVRSDYFTLYLKALYQSFSLLIYAERIQTEISAENGNYLDEIEDKNISALCAEVNLFLAKSMATSVSHIHHQSEFYVYLKKQLRIHDDIKSVTSGLEALDVLHREQDKIESEKELREREERDKESDDRLSNAMLRLSLLAVFSAAIDGFDITANFFDWPNGDFWPLPLFTKVVELLVMVLIGYIAFKTIKAVKIETKNKENNKN